MNGAERVAALKDGVTLTALLKEVLGCLVSGEAARTRRLRYVVTNALDS